MDPRWKPFAACVCLATVCAVVYANSLTVPFFFDDQGAILENGTIRSLSKLGKVLSPPRGGQTVQGRPVLNLSFALNYAWSGLDVWSWHVVNIAIHAVAGMCLFGIARQTLRSPSIPELQRQHATGLAFAMALLWTLHPLQTESVTYIAQRAESLAGLLLLLTLYCSIRADRATGRAAWAVAAVVACTIGMATKEVLVVAPILVLLYDWTFTGGALTDVLRRRWRLYACLAATWTVLAFLVADSFERGGTAGLGRGVTVWEYARTQFGFILHYLRLCVWPHPLVVDYGERIATRAGEIVPAGLCVATLVAGTLVALASPRWRPLGFLGAWFFGILAPSSSIVPVVTQTGAEHRMYLPLAAVVALLIMALHRACARMPALAGTVVGPAVVCTVGLALGAVTVSRNRDYQTSFAIWRDTVAKCPDNWRAVSGLGDEYADAGQFARAIECYDASIRLFPHHSGTFNNRGELHMRLGELDPAQRDFGRAIEIDPRNAVAHLNLGIARASAGELEAALAAFSEAATIDPAAASVRCHRGVALTRMGRHTEAIADFSEAIRLNPRFDKAFNCRGHCYQATGRLVQAIADFSRAIEINPREALYHHNRGIVLGIAGRFAESVQDCSAAIRIKPDYVEAFRTRALSHMNLKHYDLARADLAELERLGGKPDARLAERLEKEAPQASPAP